jgi:hypothetical protein
MRHFVIIGLFLLAITALSAQRYARLDQNNVYIYERTFSFSGGNAVPKDVLVHTQPRFIIVQKQPNTNATISDIISKASKLKLIAEMIKGSSIVNTNLIGAGVPGYVSVSFGYQEGTGWGWYLSCPEWMAPFFYDIWRISNPDQQIYFAQPSTPTYRKPGSLNF